MYKHNPVVTPHANVMGKCVRGAISFFFFFCHFHCKNALIALWGEIKSAELCYGSAEANKKKKCISQRAVYVCEIVFFLSSLLHHHLSGAALC